ncbi:MAG TPA: sigma-54-dependent Fis family transcriptional regulator [Proteobacteria bacterium]|nr:transcriptional regulatory protein ZraR [bacterium BMS3Abin14]HDL53619.1 sigma-54-dependent Fis family transcriptional regulator [Pseudomonadota bacterium]
MSKKKKGHVLVIDDERSMRDMLEIFLGREGYSVQCCSSAGDALDALKREGPFDLSITDINMPGLSGFDFLRQSRSDYPDMPVLMITAYSSPDSAVEAMKLGAEDYITKPFRIEEIKARISAAIERRRLAEENVELQKLLEARFGFESIVGKSECMRRVFDVIERVSDMDTTVVISGESGTGKELIARALHYHGKERKGLFVTVNCGALVETLLESELFGHRKGAFTGADTDRKGLFATAAGGTLFLDEITETSSAFQVKLLRAIQEREVVPVGDTRPVKVDLRILVATNRDLTNEVREGRFREDLFYRLNVIHIEVPPLRDRKEDIPLLVDHFLEALCDRQERQVPAFSQDAMKALMSYNYPGNVRELENIVERGVALATGDIIGADLLPPEVGRRDTMPRLSDVLPLETAQLDTLLERYERQIIEKALNQAGGNRTRAAELLGVSFRSLRYRLKKYGMAEE